MREKCKKFIPDFSYDAKAMREKCKNWILLLYVLLLILFLGFYHTNPIQYKEIQSPQVIKCIGTEKDLRLFLCPCKPDKSANKGLLVSWFDSDSKILSYQFRADDSFELQCEKEIFIRSKESFEKLKIKGGYMGAISSRSEIFQKFWLVGTYEGENVKIDEDEEKENKSIVICFSENPCYQEYWNTLPIGETFTLSSGHKEPYEYGIFPLILKSDPSGFDEYLVFVGISDQKEVISLIYNTETWKIESYNEKGINVHRKKYSNKDLNNYILYDIHKTSSKDRLLDPFGYPSTHYYYLCIYQLGTEIYLDLYQDGAFLGNSDDDTQIHEKDSAILKTGKNVKDFWICRNGSKKNSFVIAWIAQEKDVEENLVYRLHIGIFEIDPKRLTEGAEEIAIDRIKTLESDQSFKGSVHPNPSIRLCQGKNNEIWLGFVSFSQQNHNGNTSFQSKNIVISKFSLEKENRICLLVILGLIIFYLILFTWIEYHDLIYELGGRYKWQVIILTPFLIVLSYLILRLYVEEILVVLIAVRQILVYLFSFGFVSVIIKVIEGIMKPPSKKSQ